MRPIPGLITLGIGFVMLALVFFVLEKLSPGRRGQPVFRRGFGLDVIYWFFTPWVTGLISRLAVFLAVVPLILALGLSWQTFRDHTYHGFGLLSRQPLAWQAVEIFLLG